MALHNTDKEKAMHMPIALLQILTGLTLPVAMSTKVPYVIGPFTSYDD